MFKCIYFFVFLFPLWSFASPHYSLSICAIFQNEAPYLKEWIEFHRLVGVQHFYLYNHASMDDYKAVLEPYLAAGLVELKEMDTSAISIEQFNALQISCYNDCLEKAREQSQWIAFIDVDEYLLPMQQDSLILALKEFEKFGGVGINWLMFGTSGIKKLLPNQLLTETLTRCSLASYAPNRHVKSIIQPQYVSHFTHPHYAVYAKNYYQVNTDKLPFDGPYSNYIRTNKLRINHYWTKDEDFFYREKLPRQIRWGGRPLVTPLLERLNATEDQHIQRFVPALKGALK